MQVTFAFKSILFLFLPIDPTTTFSRVVFRTDRCRVGCSSSFLFAALEGKAYCHVMRVRVIRGCKCNGRHILASCPQGEG